MGRSYQNTSFSSVRAKLCKYLIMGLNGKVSQLLSETIIVFRVLSRIENKFKFATACFMKEFGYAQIEKAASPICETA